jgi:hypothetical protein
MNGQSKRKGKNIMMGFASKYNIEYTINLRVKNMTYMSSHSNDSLMDNIILEKLYYNKIIYKN